MSRLIDVNTTDGVGFGNADETDAPLNVAGEFNVAGTLNLDQALGISGVVLDDSQSPIQDATVGVTLTENGNDVIYETTDVNGEYSFTEHPDGDFTKQGWHVTAAKNDAGDLFNAESKPFVRATLTPTIIQATGGDVVQDVTLNGIDYRIHAFTTVGSQTFEVTNAPAQNDTVDILLVGGGGSGGHFGGDGSGGGGGAGGLIFTNTAVVQNAFPVTVGAGGAAVTNANDGITGENTTALGLTALGGGGGGRGTDSGADGLDGGSGGGGGNDPTGVGGTGLQPTSTDGGFGNDGGTVTTSSGDMGGGGGGAGGVGESISSGGPGGDGGIGLDYSPEFTNQFGVNGFFAGGGGGGSNNSTGGIGQAGGGDGGGSDGSQPTDALPNTGSGGGGAQEGFGSFPSGAGGSGIVLIRYEI